MNILKNLLISLLVTFSALSYSESSVWEVSDGTNTLYLGGTFHMLKESDYPLPPEFEDAYKKVKWLVFETDIDVLGTPAFQQKFALKMKLPDGEKLQDHLSGEAYKALLEYTEKNHIDLNAYQGFRPQMITLIITLHELKKLGLTAQGVDSYFADKAGKDLKIKTKLESVDEQLDYLVNMGAGNESNLILQTLEDMKALPEEFSKLAVAWRKGDTDTLYQTGILPMIESYPKVYQSLLVERNNQWLPKIVQLLGHKEPKLVLVGALHLPGENGLLKQLEKKGYSVKQIR